MAEEYFIRGPEEETARGPYGIDELLTLAEAGKLTQDFYYFDPRMESWALISSNEPLVEKVFPEKKKLSLRKKEVAEIESLNEPDHEGETVKVEEMLAAAEGHTSETKHVRQRMLWRDRAASLAVPVLGIMLLISALTVLYPSWSIINAIINEEEGAYQVLFQNPIVLLGALDLIMGAFLLLNATEIFPLIRFRAMVGAGFFAIIYAAQLVHGDPTAMWMALASLAFGFGLYVCTLTLNFTLMIFAGAVGIAGCLCIAWFTNIVPLLAAGGGGS
ncbi:MAG: hypothetical protein AB3N63_14210 [Puniceicoccaceae bacterium]